MNMTTYFLGLTVEQQRAYVTNARAEAPAALEIAGIDDVAKKTSRPGELKDTRASPAKPNGKPVMASDQCQTRNT